VILLKDILLLYTGTEEIRGAGVAIEGNRVYRIARGLDVRTLTRERAASGGGDGPPIEVIDCRKLVVVPGLVNTHHHFYQTLQRCVRDIQDVPLFAWLKRLYQIWKHLDEDAIYWSTLVACGELLKTGCTTSTDNHYVFPRGKGAHFIDTQIEAAARIGMRFHPTRGSMSRGEAEGGLPPEEVVQTEDEILEDCERLISRYHDPKPGAMVRIALAPCSPFSVSEKILVESRNLASKRGVLLHTHLAETEDETAYCLENYGVRPLELMERCGWLGRDVWYAHGVHFNDAELAKLSQTDTGLCHCPTSNMRLGSGRARVPEMLKLGIRVGLGVDGSASNDTSDMIGEIRNCFLVQRLFGGSSAITARGAIDLATRGGASLLGRDDIGELREGLSADLTGIDVSDISHAGSFHDPLASVVMCGSSHNVSLTVVNGRVVVRDGWLATVDEREIVERANQAAKRMIKGA
jgi:cytosine/adenosine deaminase-related metal-dependent hydrolase